MTRKQSDKEVNDNRSRQLNPENDAYWRSRGYEERPTEPSGSDKQEKSDR